MTDIPGIWVCLHCFQCILKLSDLGWEYQLHSSVYGTWKEPSPPSGLLCKADRQLNHSASSDCSLQPFTVFATVRKAAEGLDKGPSYESHLLVQGDQLTSQARPWGFKKSPSQYSIQGWKGAEVEGLIKGEARRFNLSLTSSFDRWGGNEVDFSVTLNPESPFMRSGESLRRDFPSMLLRKELLGRFSTPRKASGPRWPYP